MTRPQDGIGLGAEIQHRLPALNALTSLRFFAAMYVAIYHLAAGHSLVKVSAAEHFLSSGDTGVSLFFILSGFILAYNYRRVDSIRDFWISRFARIYPVYLFALLLGFAYSFAPSLQIADHRQARLALTLSLMQSWYQPYADSFNGPGWTLSVEAFFYALFPFTLRGIASLTRTVFAVLCVTYIALLFFPAGMLVAGHGDHAAELVAFLTNSRLPVLHLPLFFIGCYLGTIYRPNEANAEAGRNPGLSWKLVLYAGSIASLALLCLGPSGIYEPARRGLLAFCYAATIYGLARVRRGPLTNRWMILAGEISFSIYILQMPIFRTVLGVTRRLDLGPYASIGVCLSVLITASYTVYRLVELPARIVLRRRLIDRPVRLAQI